ncbi:MAG: S-layer homology domain-containing protein [Firmicutes bacterium]|nr:S-layer homology domain-containing protein [Bacillota bacterium]
MIGRIDRPLSKLLAPLLCAALVLGAGAAGFSQPAYAEGEGPVITKQPESVEIEYPAGASFHVEVEDPDSVASYQWIMSDGYRTYELDGSSAKTDTLVIPSTMQDLDTEFYACVITNKNGSSTESDPATLTNTIRETYKPVFYVGEYAVEPGQSLDLAEKGIGSGRVDYDADGISITLTDMKFDSGYRIFDSTLSPAIGLWLFHRDSQVLEYYIHLKGDNVVENHYYDPEYNAGGVDFNAFFAGGNSDNPPTMIFDGDGTLTLNGGGNQLYSDGNIEIRANISTSPNGLHFCDGIRCINLVVEEGVQLDLKVNGTAIHTEGDLRMFKGSRITVESRSPHVSVGPTGKNLLFITGSAYLKEAEIDLTGIGDPDNFLPYDSYLASFNGVMLAGEGGLNLDASTLSIDMSSLPAERVFTLGLGGVYGGGSTNYIDLENGSTLYMDIDGTNARNADGAAVSGIISAAGDSRITANVSAKGVIYDDEGNGVSGEAAGIEADRFIEIKDSTLEVHVSGPEGTAPLGVVCGEFFADESDWGSTIYILAENGIALAADTGERAEEPIANDFSHEAGKIHLEGETAITRPEDAVIGRISTPGYAQYIVAEAVFSGSDKTKPAQEIIISGPEPEKFGDVPKGAYYHDAVYWAVDKGITLGTSETTFSPECKASRADFVRFIYRAAGSPEVSGELPFDDVKEGDDWYKAVLWAFNEGITNGVSDTEFDPAGTITRGQAVTMLHRRAGAPAAEAANPFGDVKEGDYFYDAVLWAVEKGITKGTSDTEFSPGADTDRAQIVTFLYRELKD